MTLVLSPNGNGRAIENNGVKTLKPFNGAAMVGMKEGLGIISFLQGNKFLITGSTGFLAKVLIKKVLRMAPDVGKIYLLIKAKNKEAAIKRLKNEVLDAELFNTLKETHEASYLSFMLSKLVPVTGNICHSELGLQADSAEEIAKEVDVIIISAANTTFNERLAIIIDYALPEMMRDEVQSRKLKYDQLMEQIGNVRAENKNLMDIIMMKLLMDDFNEMETNHFSTCLSFL